MIVKYDFFRIKKLLSGINMVHKIVTEYEKVKKRNILRNIDRFYMEIIYFNGRNYFRWVLIRHRYVFTLIIIT